jgi:hypothetical protein
VLVASSRVASDGPTHVERFRAVASLATALPLTRQVVDGRRLGALHGSLHRGRWCRRCSLCLLRRSLDGLRNLCRRRTSVGVGAVKAAEEKRTVWGAEEASIEVSRLGKGQKRESPFFDDFARR